MESPPRARSTSLREFGHALRRAFEAARQYQVNHTTAREALERLQDAAMSLVAAHGELDLEVTAMSITCEEVVVNDSQRRDDALAQPLFREGVRRITLTPDATREELQPFFRRWVDNWLSPLHAESVAGLLWETQPKGVRVIVIDSFEVGGFEGEGSDGTTSASLKNQVDAIVASMASGTLSGEGGDRVPGQTLRVSAQDLQVLQAEHLRSITGAELASHDAAASQLTGLTEEECGTLSGELNAVCADVEGHFLNAVVNGALLGRDEDRDQAVRLFGALTQRAVERGRCAHPFELYRAQVARVAQDTSLGTMRTALLRRLKGALLTPGFLDALAVSLDEASTAPEGVAAFNHLGRSGVPLLIDRMSLLKTAEGRKRAMDVLSSHDPNAAARLSQARTIDAAGLEEAVRASDGLPPADRLSVLQRAMTSPDAAVRRLAIGKLDVQSAARLPAQQLNNRIGDTDPHVRAKAIQLAKALETPAAAPALVATLKRQLANEERAAIFEALGAIGGTPALNTLVHELEHATLELKVAAAHALGRMKDPEARLALSRTAAKFLAPPALRRACREALGVTS